MKKRIVLDMLDIALRNVVQLKLRAEGKKSDCAADKLENLPIYLESWVIPQLESAIKELERR